MLKGTTLPWKESVNKIDYMAIQGLHILWPTLLKSERLRSKKMV